MISTAEYFNTLSQQASFLVLQNRAPSEIPGIDPIMEDVQQYRYKFIWGY